MTGCCESPWSAAKLQLKKERLQCPNQQLHRNKQCIQTANVLLKIIPASEVIEILTSEGFENYFEWLNLESKSKEPLKVLASSGIKGTKFIPVYSFQTQ